jgi:nicotinate-nucleotide adenylyltransferase
MRIGIFGGSFDPVHLGHLWIAEAAKEALALTELRWIPAAQSPLKAGGPAASGSQRMTMLQLALAGLEDTVVDDRELRRGDVSYTVDTLSELRREFPQAELLLIIGSDSLATMKQWHQAEKLLAMTTLAVVRRGGEPEPDFSVLQELVDPERIDWFRRCTIPMPLIEISSSELRARVAQGRSIRFRTPRAVEAFIRAEELYRPTASRAGQGR